MSFAPTPALRHALLDADLGAALRPVAGREARPSRHVLDRAVERPRAVELPTAGAGRGAARPDALLLGTRDRLVGARELVRAAARQVPAARWACAPAPGRWSAAEVVEHLVLAERAVLAFVAGPLREAPPAPVPTIGDARLLAVTLDRTRRHRAPERCAPAGRWTVRGPLLDAFDAARAATLAHLRDAGDELAAHAAPHPALGWLDGRQWLLFAAAHAERHVAQLLAPA